MMRTVALTQGKVALVDDADYATVAGFRWFAMRQPNGRWYALRNAPKGQTKLMHRLIIAFPGKDTDHENHNGLDNRRGNLRPASRAQNNANSRKQEGTTSRFKGVSWHRQRARWRAYICVDWKQEHLGLFDFEEDAARAYDEAARKYFGEFALTNFSTDGKINQ